MNEHTTDVTGGLQQMEGYLLWQAEVATARRDADAFTDRLPWLTTGQREEVAHAFAQERLRISRLTVTHIARRCTEMRGDYEERYRRLRRGLVALLVGTAAVAATAAAEVARAWP